MGSNEEGESQGPVEQASVDGFESAPIARIALERTPSSPGLVKEERTPPHGTPAINRRNLKDRRSNGRPREGGPPRAPWIALAAIVLSLAGVWWFSGGGGGPAYGELLVASSPPGAAIIVNGLDTGKRTPAKLEGLPLATPVRVTVATPGFVALPRESIISIDPDARSDSVSFELTGGRALRVESKPPNALVHLDGVALRERTPASLPPLPIGEEVEIVVDLEGHLPAKRKLRVSVDMEETLEVRLERAETIAVITSPPGARVLMNGEDRGRTPLELAVPTRRLFELVLDAPGYHPFKTRTRAPRLRKKRIEVELKELPLSALSLTPDERIKVHTFATALDRQKNDLKDALEALRAAEKRLERLQSTRQVLVTPVADAQRAVAEARARVKRIEEAIEESEAQLHEIRADALAAEER